MSSCDAQFSYAILKVTRDDHGAVDGFYYLTYYDHTGVTNAENFVGWHCPTEVVADIGDWLDVIAAVADTGQDNHRRAVLGETGLTYDATHIPVGGDLVAATWTVVDAKDELIARITELCGQMPDWLLERTYQSVFRSLHRFGPERRQG